MVAGSGDRKAKKGRSPALYRPHKEDKIPVLIAECSEQTLALAVVLSSSSLDLGEDRLVRVDMLRLSSPAALANEGPLQTVRRVWRRVQVRVRAGVVGCRLGGEDRDGTSSHPNLRGNGYTCESPSDIKVSETDL
jgi:hypothetical protein